MGGSYGSAASERSGYGSFPVYRATEEKAVTNNAVPTRWLAIAIMVSMMNIALQTVFVDEPRLH